MAQALDKDSALGQVSKNFQVYLIHMSFFRKQKKIILAPKSSYILRCYYTRFSILHCLLAQKKWKLKNNSRLPTLSYFFHTNYHNDLPAFGNKNYVLHKLLKIDFLNVIKHF